jgi:hypothetical protein
LIERGRRVQEDTREEEGGQALVPAALQQVQELDEGIGHGTAAARGGGGRRECTSIGAASAGSRDGAGVLAAGLRRPPQLFPRLQVSRRPLLASSVPLSQAGSARWNASVPVFLRCLVLVASAPPRSDRIVTGIFLVGALKACVPSLIRCVTVCFGLIMWLVPK